MKKANKIVMATVAILLSLVLFTTSIVSGIFAMYAVRTYGSASFTFKKFGVIVELSFSDEFNAIYGDIIKDNTVVNGDSVTITIPTLKMAPGDSFMDAVQFNISGTATTECRVKINPAYMYDRTDFSVSDTQMGFTDNYFPYNFYCRLGDDPSKGKLELHKGNKVNSDYLVEYNAIDALSKATDCYGNQDTTKVNEFSNETYNDYYLSKRFSPGATVQFTDKNAITGKGVFNRFAFGFEWLFEEDDMEKFDAIHTWLANQNELPKFKMSYTVVVEAVT